MIIKRMLLWSIRFFCVIQILLSGNVIEHCYQALIDRTDVVKRSGAIKRIGTIKKNPHNSMESADSFIVCQS